jgi:hypothetical protein
MESLTSELDGLVGQPFFDKFDGKSTTVQDINLPVIMEQLRTATPNWLRLLDYDIFSVTVARLGQVIAARWLWMKGWHMLLRQWFAIPVLGLHPIGFRRCLAFIFTVVVSSVGLLMSYLGLGSIVTRLSMLL